MGNLFKRGNWLVRVNGGEHPPIHVHIEHADGKALVYLHGRVLNSGVPAPVIAEVKRWISDNEGLVIDEWNSWN